MAGNNKKCKLCGETGSSVLHKSRDYLVSGSDFPVIKCNSCSFKFTGDCPPEKEIGQYYKSENYISHSDTSKGILARLYHLARTLMLRRKYNLVKKYTGLKKGTLLDIGCGTGYFPGYFKKHGWEAIGIEKDENTRKYATSINGVEVFDQGHIKSLQSNHFDCITMWHVLEHFHDPDSALNSAIAALKNAGILLIALPNCDSYDANYYGPDWAAWDVPRHLWHFTPSTFGKYISGFNLEISAIHRLPFDSFYVSILSEKNRQNRMPLIWGTAIGKLSFLKSLANVRNSSSIIYVVRKKVI